MATCGFQVMSGIMKCAENCYIFKLSMEPDRALHDLKGKSVTEHRGSQTVLCIKRKQQLLAGDAGQNREVTVLTYGFITIQLKPDHLNCVRLTVT